MYFVIDVVLFKNGFDNIRDLSPVLNIKGQV